jgi:kynurenine formamidase
VLDELLAAVRAGSVDVVDLTAKLSEHTPVIQLPEPFVNTPGFALDELSRYDDRGPAWYWNAIRTGEHVGTHFDAPIHWVTGKDSLAVDLVPVAHLVAPAVVVDMSKQVADDPDFLLEVEHVEAWQDEHGPLPDGWLLYRTGWDARSHEQEAFLNADETGPHTPGMSVECARWLAEELGDGGRVVGVNGIAGHPANEARWSGAQEVLEDAGIEIVTQANANWSQAEGQSVMQDLLNQHGDNIDGVWAQDGVAEGVLRALIDADRLDLVTTGEARAGYMRLWDEVGISTIGVVNPPGVGATALPEEQVGPPRRPRCRRSPAPRTSASRTSSPAPPAWPTPPATASS